MGDERSLERLALDILDEGVMVLDRDWRCLLVNEAAAQLMGRPAGEMVGETVLAHVRAAADDPIYASLERAWESGGEEAFTAHEPGSGRHYAYRATRLGSDALAIRFRDVTAARAVEDERERLRRDNARVVEILDGIDEAFFAVDAEWRITFANAAAAARVGHEPEDVVGQWLWEVAPTMADSAVADVARRVMETRAPQVVEGLDSTSGRWTEFSITPLADGGLAALLRDTTEARELERQLAGLVELLPVGAFRADADGAVLHANRAYLDLLGYATVDELRSVPLAERTLPVGDQVAFRTALASGDGTVVGFPTTLRRADGSLLRVRLSARAERDGDRVVGLQGVLEDATAETIAREALELAEARFRALMGAETFGVWVADDAGEVVAANGYLARVADVPVERTLGRRWLDLVHPDERARIEAVDRSTPNDAENVMRYRVVAADGSAHHVVDTGVPVRTDDGRVLGQVGTVVDVTERLELEAGLERASSFFAGTLAAAPVGLAIVDRELTYVWVNETIERHHGTETGTHVGRAVQEMLPPIDHDVVGHYERVLGSGVPELGIHVAAQARGEVREYVVDYYPIVVQGTVTGVGVVTRDVTEERRADQAVARTSQLEALGTMAGGIANDFNNLLGLVQSHAELCLADVAPGSEAAAHLERIVRATRRGADVTASLLALAGRVDLAHDPVDLVAVARGAVEELGPTPGVEVVVVAPPETVVVRGDATVLRQAALSLCANAVEAMPGGGTLRLAIRAESAVGVLAVEDDGAGMDAATLARVFDPYFTTKPHGQSVGLRLSILHVLLHRLGGQVTGTSRRGEGSTFALRLPLHEPATDEADGPDAGEPAAVSARPPAARPGATVLVVDDVAEFRSLLSMALRARGHRVLEAADGIAALRLVDDEAPDVVFADVAMPRLGGTELASRLREQAPAARIVLMSGNPTPEATSVADLFLLRPFGPAAALEALDSVLAAPRQE